MNEVSFDAWTARAPALADAFEAWRRREDRLERTMQTLPAAAIERFEGGGCAGAVGRRSAHSSVQPQSALVRVRGGAATSGRPRRDHAVGLLVVEGFHVELLAP